MSLLDYFAEKTAQYADKPYLFFYGQELSYAQFADKVYRLAHGLRKLGIGKGDFVHILVENSPETLLSYFAIQHLGAVAGPINGWWKAEEIRYLLNDSKGSALIIGPHYLETLDKIRVHCPHLQTVIEIDGPTRSDHVSFESLIEDSPSERIAELVLDSDPAYIFYTSGTTGQPKGVLLSHRNVIADLEGVQDILNVPELCRVMIFLPLFHVNAMLSCVSSMQKGHAVILRTKFSAKDFWPTVEQYKVNFFSAVPAVYSILLKDPDRAKFDTSSLMFGICGAAPMPVQTFNDFERTFGIPIVEGYGLTEATCVSTLNPRDGIRKVGSIGLPISGQEVRIVDENNKEQPVGEPGEILIRGNAVMLSYYNRPEETAEAIDAEGCLHTGDVGYRDKDGYIFIVDRIKEMVIRGGENIYPKEIDNAIAANPKVLEAACVGVPDTDMGEEVKAFVVLRDGKQASEEEIRDWCAQHLAEFKVPRYVEFLERDFPRNPIGKVLKKDLKRWAVDGVPQLEQPQVEVADIFGTMEQRFNSERAGDFNGRVGYEITGEGGGSWTVSVIDSVCKVSEGIGEVDVRVMIAARDWIGLTLGTLDGMTAFGAGKIKAEGDLSLLMGLTKLFNPYQP
ncbi:MAG: long-chain-fatty-acid--CoA ligase [Candidatus Alcyoniella australis]|nr:long-chain-fatty-acid--CoA ligase [Candidatus Alcyoniella australis]